jgi:hypothetical protein
METLLIDIVGVPRSQGRRAVKWLADHRSMLAVYDERTMTLRAFETKFGAESTRNQMYAALEATR